MSSKTYRSVYLIAAVTLLIGCSTAAPPNLAPPPDGTGQEPPAELLWVATAPEYRMAAEQTYRAATRKIEVLSADRPAGEWGVILDVDETVLNNVGYELENFATGGSFELDSWNAWCRREQAPAVPGAKAFIQRVHELGGKVALVTNRMDEVADATRSNISALGIPFDVLLPKTTTSDKSARIEAVRKGTASPSLGPLEVLLFLGDNIRDFPGHGAAADQPELFGKRYFVLPNPMYGSWEGNELPN